MTPSSPKKTAKNPKQPTTETPNFIWRWTAPLASVAAFFSPQFISGEELAATLKGSKEDIARSDRIIKETDRLNSEVDARINGSTAHK